MRETISLLIVTWLLLASSASIAEKASAQGNAPEWARGDQWEYTGNGFILGIQVNLLMRIEVSETTQVTVNQSNYEAYHCALTFTVSVAGRGVSGFGDAYVRTSDLANVKANLDFQGNGTSIVYDPPAAGLEFPLSQGKTWSWDTVIRSVTTENASNTYSNMSSSGDVVVGGVQSVTVPAGTFDVYNITTYPRGSNQNGSVTYYSDKVGNLVMTQGTLFGAPFPFSMQLKSYKYQSGGQTISSTIIIAGILLAVIIALAVILIVRARRRAKAQAMEHREETEYGEPERVESRYQPPPAPPQPPSRL